MLPISSMLFIDDVLPYARWGDWAAPRLFSHFALASHYAELRSFAAKKCQTVENDRE
jgi:hypothetical protein